MRKGSKKDLSGIEKIGLISDDLISAVYEIKPEIADYIYGEHMNIINAELLVVSIFGKLWNTSLNDSESVNVCRDLQNEIENRLRADFTSTRKIDALSNLVQSMFEQPAQISTQG